MASMALIISHNNSFKGYFKENAFYFSNPHEVKELLLTVKGRLLKTCSKQF
jgi:hypothetical protein